jgi:hypothetical protein
MNIDIKSPWIIVAGIILITTLIATIVIPPFIPNSKETKEIIDEKIEDGEVMYKDIIKNGDLVRRNYSDEWIHIATDLFDERGKRFRRDYYDTSCDKNGHNFARSYYDGSGKITYTQYLDCEGNAIKIIIVPPLPPPYL